MTPGLVTVAFVDVEASTELLTRLGDDEGVATIGAVLDAVRERVSPYGGREIKALGDGLMLVFAAPRQAVAFAVAVQRARVGKRPRLRIGVNTGEVIASNDDVVGEAVTAAARITAKAAGGEVLVSDVVRQLVGSMPGVRFADRGRTRLKGFPDRWRLFAVDGSESAPAAPVVFGRDQELAAIDDLFTKLTDGSGRALVFEGEAGIGKTHLAGAVRARASALGMTVLEGGADELEQDRPGRILFAVAERLAVPAIAPLNDGGSTGASRGFALVEAVVDAIENAAAARPVVVIAEDLHWADELSLRGVAALARRLAPLPVALVVTMRPSPRPPLLATVLDALRDAGGRVLRVSGLDGVAVGSLVATITGAAPGPTLATRLAGTAGNPLYITELLRALDDEGALRVDAGVAEMDARSLPADVRETVVRRLSSLPADTVELLRLASLLGGEFTLTDLAAVAGRSVVDVAALLRDPVQAGLLAGEGDTLSFRHDLIREAVYDDIAPAIRRDLHAAAGRALVGHGAPVLQVARQLALGARPGDVEAAEWLERAGNEALALDPGTAITLFQQALAVAPEQWTERTTIEIALLEPLAICGQIDASHALGSTVLDRDLTAIDEFAAHWGLAAVLGYSGDYAASALECETAAAVPGAPTIDAQVSRCVAAGLSVTIGASADAAHVVAVESLALAEADHDEHLASVAQQALAIATGAQGTYDRALAHARSSRVLLDGLRQPSTGWLAPHIWEGVFLAHLDNFDDAFDAFAAARQRAERRGQLSLLPLIHAYVGQAMYLLGRWDDAVSELEAGLTWAHETGSAWTTALPHALLASVALGRGDLIAAEVELAKANEIATNAQRLGIDVLLWTQASVLASRGEPGPALALLTAVWEHAANVRFLLQFRNLGPDLVRLAREQGNTDLTATVAADMEHAASRCNSPSAAAAALRSRGLANDDPGLLVEAAARYRSTPRRVELAATCEDAAASLFRDERKTEAVELLDEAAALHIEMDARANLARVDALLRANGVRRRRSGPARAQHGWDSLSPSERTIVDLVSQGLSNPQIGERLYISRRTVETHLSHVFRKLDVSSRAQLAAAAATQALTPHTR